MAQRKSAKEGSSSSSGSGSTSAGSSGGSSSPGSRREIKHGGHKNGRKRGLSGSSFFTWFMVIALLGVWTSVAVVWFDLIDYEEVLGKLGLYDADGDGDFDVDDAKILLGLSKDGSNENIDSLDEALNILAEESSDWFYGFLSFLYDIMTPFEMVEEEEEEESETADGVDEGPSGVSQRKTKAKVKELVKEELKKEKEKPKSRKEHKNEERKKEKKENDDLKDRKVADLDISRKEFTKSEKERVKRKKVGQDKTAETKDTKKKLTNIKDISSKMVPRDKDDPKEDRRSIKHTQLTKKVNQKKNLSTNIIRAN